MTEIAGGGFDRLCHRHSEIPWRRRHVRPHFRCGAADRLTRHGPNRVLTALRPARDSGHAWSAYQRLRVENAGGLDGGATEFLNVHDTAYRTRRLRFLSRQIAILAEAQPQSNFEPVRLVVFERLNRLFDLQRNDIDLIRFDADTDAVLATALAACAKTDRRAPLLAYLGFPFYDVATYALLQGEGLDEFDTIKVDRISPDEAQSIRKGGARATLKGIQFNSFGAFFNRAYRENDYLWGRLHGAERLIDITLSTLPAGAELPASKIASIKQAIFEAILDEEALRCAAITPLILQLRLEVAAMTGIN